jgi:hypothetical protein
MAPPFYAEKAMGVPTSHDRPDSGRSVRSANGSDRLAVVSFDVFFQGFIAGESSEGGGAEMREILAPHVTEEDRSFLHVKFGDGEADIYLSDDGMMANHVLGRDPWNLLVEGARAANWVIMPMGCPTCVTQPGQREELPRELNDDLVVIDTAADLLRVIESP